MNRGRPANAGADRAAQNAQTLKALVKLEGNKVCADCKRNKHPRWASWNLGVFVCIRCSGIHRGMGTHISRVKSVDLDAWTDEQLQSVLKWGNTRANKYWEAKLAPGHVPSEAKIENFIRTKYESKRWIMDGPMPDPSTLSTDDDVPLNIVQEKAKIERSASQKQAAAGRPGPPPAPVSKQPAVDLFGDFDPPPRPSTTDIPSARPAQTNPPPAPKQSKPQDSLMGLDFFGNNQSAGIGRPSSASSNPAASTNTRGDLKNSILSLYASAPKPQAAPPVSHDRQPSFGGMTSAPPQKQDAFGGLTDAFGGLNFSSNAPQSPPMQPASSTSLAGLSFPSNLSAKSPPSAPQVTSPPPLSGGNFFDTTSPKSPAAKPAAAPQPSSALDFSFTQRTPPAPVSKPVTTSIPADLFADDGFNDFSPAPSAAPVSKNMSPPSQTISDFSSAFKLSSPTISAPKPAPAPQPARPAFQTQSSSSMFDPWGSADTNAWGAAEPSPPKQPAQPKVELGSVPTHITPNDISSGWGEPISSANKPTAQPTVTADEDFGGWTSASATQTPAASKPSGGFGGSDPFDNPWG